jgi:hypothetical protein
MDTVELQYIAVAQKIISGTYATIAYVYLACYSCDRANLISSNEQTYFGGGRSRKLWFAYGTWHMNYMPKSRTKSEYLDYSASDATSDSQFDDI